MKRNLNSELEADLAALETGAGSRRIEYAPNSDGSVTKRTFSTTGQLESTEVLTGARWELFAARQALGYSQNQLASLLGVSGCPRLSFFLAPVFSNTSRAQAPKRRNPHVYLLQATLYGISP